jgi:hypothetical protein
MADASGTCPECNDLEIDDIGIWVLVECSPGQCVYELTAASRSMFDDEWRLRSELQWRASPVAAGGRDSWSSTGDGIVADLDGRPDGARGPVWHRSPISRWSWTVTAT